MTLTSVPGRPFSRGRDPRNTGGNERVVRLSLNLPSGGYFDGRLAPHSTRPMPPSE